jgi:hypothetical protein
MPSLVLGLSDLRLSSASAVLHIIVLYPRIRCHFVFILFSLISLTGPLHALLFFLMWSKSDGAIITYRQIVVLMRRKILSGFLR